MKILIINGVNLNMLGQRQPEIYGSQTLDEINEGICKAFNDQDIDFIQSNFEGEIVDQLHNAAVDYDGIILNAGAHTHYSYAIADAIACIDVPVIEVHLSNIGAREDFRKTSVISAVCKGSISGFGEKSYHLAMHALIDSLIIK